MLSVGVLISGFFHTRSLVVYFFLFLSLTLFFLWKRLPEFFQRVGFVLVLIILIAELGFTRVDVMLEPLLNTYIHNDLFITGLILFLIIFSAKAFMNITMFSLLLMSLLLAGLFIPVNRLFPAYGNLVLLDRPYVQMLLYLPLSILGGLGLAGLCQYVQKLSCNSKKISQLITALLFGFVIFNAGFKYNLYPSTCCQIIGRDDLAAFAWMDRNLPLDTNILIASTGMYVTSVEQADSQVGVDGGAWINALISRKTISMSGTLEFNKPEIKDEVCNKNSSYIYVGGETLSFNNTLLAERPVWYQVVLSLPGTKVYKVIGCK
jgi:hypothetical protein